MTRKAFIIVGLQPCKEYTQDELLNLNKDELCNLHKAQLFNLHVDADSKNMRDFLESDLGGSWKNKDDLTIHINESKATVLESLNVADQEYTFIYFTGHGGLVEQGEIIELKNREQLRITELKTKSLKQIVIIEACRCPPLTPTDSEAPPNNFRLPEFKKLGKKDIFDNYFKNCDNCNVIVFATKENSPSGSDNQGSYFTQALIEATDNWDKNQNSKSMFSINEAVRDANRIMRQKDRNQEAVIYTHPNISTKFPFAISTEDK